MDDDKHELTADDVRILKEMVEQERNYRWLRSSVRSAASWVAIVISAIALMWDNISAWLRGGPL